MKTTITTSATPVHDRSRHWHDAIATAYFPLELQFRNADSFSGDLSIWTLGDVSLSRLTSDALQYRRLPHHVKSERGEHFLVTVPARSEVFFSQCGKDVRCNPGGRCARPDQCVCNDGYRLQANIGCVPLAVASISPSPSA